MKQLSVVHYPFYGGPQNQALRLNEPLRARGWQTTVLLPDEPGEAAERLRAAGVDVITMPLHRLRTSLDPRIHAAYLLGMTPEVWRIRRLIRYRRIDLVQINGLINPHAAIAARLEGIPVVWQLLDTRPPIALRRVAMPLVKRLADVVMSTGLGVAAVHPGAAELGDRLVPFFPPVDTATFRPDGWKRREARERLGLPEGAQVVGMIANFTPQKGHLHFLEASEEIARSVRGSYFAMLGGLMETQARYRRLIQDRAQQTGLLEQGRLVTLDPGPEVALFLQAFDVFLLPSVPLSEGIPTTVLEAMASGVPVVTADVGAVREAVEDETTGLVVPTVNSRALAAAVLRILQDRGLASRLADAARRRAEESFDSQICADSHVRAYELALARRATKYRRPVGGVRG